MKKILTVLFCLSTVLNIYSQAVFLSWDDNPEPDIAGYRIWYGTNSRVYPQIVDLGARITNLVLHPADKPWTNKNNIPLQPGTPIVPFIWGINNFPYGQNIYFAATAYNTSALESDLSLEAILTIPYSTNMTNVILASKPRNFAVERVSGPMFLQSVTNSSPP